MNVFCMILKNISLTTNNNMFAVDYSSKQPDVLPRSAVSFESPRNKVHSDKR